jgi:hypothetical protein
MSGPMRRSSPLERFPDHTKAIGMITVEMGTLEAALCHLLGAFLCVDERMAGALFFSQKSTRGRIEMMENIITELVTGPPRRDADRIMEKANKLLGKRNDVVHQLWGVSMDHFEVMRIPLPYGDPRPVPLTELTQLVSSLRALSDEVESLTSALWLTQRSTSNYCINITYGPVVKSSD